MSVKVEPESNNTERRETQTVGAVVLAKVKREGAMVSVETPIGGDNHFNLKGVFRIGGQRNFTFPVRTKDYFLVCDRFWHEERLAVCVTENGVNLFEIFTISNDQTFLEKVGNNYLHVEFSKITKKSKHAVIGLLRLPLHHFFIAYRDAAITKRLCDGQLPVLSTDAWVPIVNFVTGEKVGEVECLLAIGTDKQIENMRLSRKWLINGLILPTTFPKQHHQLNNNSHSNIDFQMTSKLSLINPPVEKSSLINLRPETVPQSLKIRNTSDLLNTLQISLAAPSSIKSPVKSMERNTITASFRIHLEIKSARDLTLNPSHKVKKKLKHSAANKGTTMRFPPGEEPNTYVTFQANASQRAVVKSHEGMVYSTNVIEKTSNPIWNESFCISVSLDFLMNKNQKFILNIWRKATNLEHCRPVPCPMEDSIIGFAAIDFINLLKNVPFITGWFNIVDFNGHINGQIKLIAQPLEDLQKLIDLTLNTCDNQVDNLLDSFESSLNINNINLSRAIKRKFTELEGISHRLQARLLDVTGNVEFKTDVGEITDEQLDEFEHDLNTKACEDENVVDDFSDHITYT